MLQKYGKVLLTKCHRVNTVGSKIRHITTRPTKPRFATPPKRPIAEDIPKDAFKDDPNFSAFLKRQAWEDEEGPDPTPEELEEENRLADAEPVTPEDIKLQEELEKASNEALLEFIDMDQIAQRTGATDVFEPPRARYKGKFWDKRGEVDVEVTRAENELTFKVRGFRFISSDLVNWELPGAYTLLARDAFTMSKDKEKTLAVSMGAEDAVREGPRQLLDKYKLEFSVPIDIAHLDEEGKEIVEVMNVTVFIARDTEVSEKPVFKLYLTLPDGNRIESDVKDRFSDAMFQIQTRLPRLKYFRNCFGCANAEFTPLQRRPYGGLACFRKKPKHLTFRSNSEIIRNWSKVEEIVQELHSCASFRRRTSKRPEPIEVDFSNTD